MRVAHFVQRYPPALGGSEAYFARLSRSLVERGDDVTVFTSNALDLEAFWKPAACLPTGTEHIDGVEVRRYDLWRFPGRRFVLKALSVLPQRTLQCLALPCNPISWRMLADAGRVQQRFDVVHATSFPYAWPIVCARRLARRQGIPFLLTPFLHLGDPDDPHDRTRRSYTTPALMSLVRSADRVFVQTTTERDALRERAIPEDRIVLQGMGVDAAECVGGDRERARAGWNVGPEDVVVGHLANNSVEKGTVDLLAAAERAWRRGCRFKLVLAGPQMPNFRRVWDSFAPKQDVRCLGRLSDEDKRDFFAGIDVFALPSRSDSFGLVLLEAWANGVPNIGYRAGGVAGVIRHEEDGCLVRCGDLDGLAAALRRLVENSELRRSWGRAGRERIEREFRWDDKLELVRREYASCAERAATVRER